MSKGWLTSEGDSLGSGGLSPRQVQRWSGWMRLGAVKVKRRVLERCSEWRDAAQQRRAGQGRAEQCNAVYSAQCTVHSQCRPRCSTLASDEDGRVCGYVCMCGCVCMVCVYGVCSVWCMV